MNACVLCLVASRPWTRICWWRKPAYFLNTPLPYPSRPVLCARLCQVVPLPPSPKIQVLYASVQALLYVLCYHLETLLQLPPQQQQQQQQHHHHHHHHHHSNQPSVQHVTQQPQPAPKAHKHSHLLHRSTADTARQLVRERVLPLLQHPLQPLNVCLPSVVAEFKHQVAAAGIAELPSGTPPVSTLLWPAARALRHACKRAGTQCMCCGAAGHAGKWAGT